MNFSFDPNQGLIIISTALVGPSGNAVVSIEMISSFDVGSDSNSHIPAPIGFR